MAHGLIAEADFTAVADHLAYHWLQRDAMRSASLPLFGQLSAADNADLTAWGVEDAARRLDDKLYSEEWFNTVCTDFLNSLIKHLGAEAVTDTAKDAYASIDAYLTGEGIRVHEAFNDICYMALGAYLTPANVFDQADKLLGTINWSGSGTGTLTDGVALSALTGGNSLQWRIPTGKAVTSSEVVLTLKPPTGPNVTETVTIVGSAGDTGDIGTHFDDLYTDLVSISISSGGANGNQAVIESVCDRDPALIS